MKVSSAGARVLFVCVGAGRYHRGIETFFSEAFAGLQSSTRVEIQFAKGAGPCGPQERIAWSLPRDGLAADLIGRLTRRNGYVVEQWTSFPSVAYAIRSFRPHVIFFSDSNLGFLLYWLRPYLGVPYVLLYSNGAPLTAPFVRVDYVQQVTPSFHRQAIEAGEPASRHFLVPYGFDIPDVPPDRTPASRSTARSQLGLPQDRPVILSVGWISRRHKRMDYIVSEVARLPSPRPFLVLLGTQDAESAEIASLASTLLGPDNFAIRTVTPSEVRTYYAAADLFALASLTEGFGRVYIEALAAGLPVLAHDFDVARYVLGEEGAFGDFSCKGELATLVLQKVNGPADTSAAERRWSYARSRFGWDALRPAYEDMFLAAAARSRL